MKARFILAALAAIALAAAPSRAELPGSGTAADPYRISSVADWNIFAANVNAGVDAAACYRLGADIGSVSTTVGTAGHPFSGVFDGGSNTLTVALSGSDRAIAPFSAISGATIRNLKVAGTVSCAIHCSGLVGEVFGGTNLIEGCEVAAAISSSESHFGGFIGHSVTYAVTLRGCVFSGSLSGGTYVATFHGWSDTGAETTLIDCLDASASDQPIGRGYDAACVSNTFYLATKNFSNGERLWSAAKRGKRAYAVTAGEGVAIDFGAPSATYGTAGLAAYGPGIVYREIGTPGAMFYAAEGDAVRMDLAATPPSGMMLSAYVASAGTLSQSGNAWTLAMPGENVVISATYDSVPDQAEPTVLARQCGAFGIVTYDLPVTQTTVVPVPHAWLDAHVPGVAHEPEAYEAAALATAANGRKVWECYVLGLDPQVATSDFRIASFPMKADGTPDFANVAFDPPQEQWNVPDAPVVWKGAAQLEGPWRTVLATSGSAGRARPATRFFKAVVFGNADDDPDDTPDSVKLPEEYGYYFWWGDTVGYTNTGSGWISVTDGTSISFSYSDPAKSTYRKAVSELLRAGYIDATDNLVAEYDAATAHLGSPWRMPTVNEIDALTNKCTATWITTNGVNGCLVTGTGEYADRCIFLPAAGYVNQTTLTYFDEGGYYWSSMPSSNTMGALDLYISLDGFGQGQYIRYNGLPVRPVRDTAQ